MRNLALLFILISVNLSFANDGHVHCEHENLNAQSFDDFKRFVHLHQHVGSRREVAKNSCNTKLTTSKIERMILDKAKKGSWWKTSKESHGIKFEDEYPELIDLFDKLATKEGWITTNYQFDSNCKKVLCAVKEIFGRDVGSRILYIMQEYGLNGSHLSFRNTSNWNKEELDVLLQGLEDLPKGMLPLDDNRSFVRMKRGYTYTKYNIGDGCVGANSEIRFFDCWWEDFHGSNRMSVLAHEVAHYVGEELAIDDTPEWLSLSGWETELYYDSNRKLRSRWSANKDACFLSTYGQTKPAEDFAEMFVAYRYSSETLKKECPKKYNFMKDLVFNGIEFTKDKNFCEKRPRLEYENGMLRFFRRKIIF